MAAHLLKKLPLLFFLSALATGGTAKPVASPKNQYVEDALRKRADLNIVKTTVTEANTIDWIPIQSQGEIASPPPPRSIKRDATSNATIPLAELELPGAELGPPGTVPVPRVNLDYLTQATALKGGLPDRESSQHDKRQYSGNHWYVSSNQNVNNFGGTATFSMFNAYVQNSGDFSLLQTAVIKSNVPIPNNPSATGSQTVEAGWINYPAQVSQPHLFTYFTTDGYQGSGDNVGGWNQDVKGWVQTDSTYFPGTVFVPLSVDGGTQDELQLGYQLFQGNWWLWCINKWIGYYPASMFSAGESNPAATLANGADGIFYYGEIYQSENALTTTDMGSGQFASTGFGHSAYIQYVILCPSSHELLGAENLGSFLRKLISRIIWKLCSNPVLIRLQ